MKDNSSFKVPINPKCFFFTRMNLCTCSKRIAVIFSFSWQILPFYRLRKLRRSSIFCSRPSQKGSGSIPVLTSQSTLHAFLQRVNAMQISFWRQNRNRPTPLLTRSWTKDAWIFTTFEAYKMAGFVRKRKKMAAMRFERVQRFILAKKNILGLWAL